MSGQHTGHSDIALTEAGCASAKALNTWLKNFTFAAVFTSPLKRALQTAGLAGYGSVAEPVLDLREWDYGDYEGRTTAAIRAERPEWRLFKNGCPNGESPDVISERADRVVARIQQVHAGSGNVLIFAHSDILRVLVARWLHLPALEGRHFLLATGSLSVLGYDHDLNEPAIRSLNQSATDALALP